MVRERVLPGFTTKKKEKKTLSGADPQGFQRGGSIQSYYRTYLRIWTDTPEQTVWA